MKNVIAFFAGLLFASGLVLGSMTHPKVVRDFLDITGSWDPRLLFVMGGAVAVYSLSYWLLKKRRQTLFGSPLQIPKSKLVDKNLIIGSLCFGVGWGLSGYCPGPAITASVSLDLKVITYVAAMFLGMFTYRYLNQTSENHATSGDDS